MSKMITGMENHAEKFMRLHGVMPTMTQCQNMDCRWGHDDDDNLVVRFPDHSIMHAQNDGTIVVRDYDGAME
jgi:hypothetical protein